MIKAKLADGRVLEFPDGTDPNVVQATVKKMMSENNEFSVKETIKNIPSSAANFAKDLVHPILHPIDTAKSIQSLSQGLIEKVLPEQQTAEGKFGQTENEQVVDAVGKFIDDRYGSVDNFKKTVQNDPVSVLADASIVLTGGGSLTAKTGKLSSIAKGVQEAGKAIEPLNLAVSTIQGIRKSGVIVPESVPEKLLESALKFRPSISSKQRTAMTKTALREGILPTVNGLKKITDKLDTLNTDLNKIIDTATERGVLINKQVLFNQLGKLRKDVGGAKLDAGADLRMIDAVAKSFNEQLKKIDKDKLTPREVQDLKTDAYKRINFDLQQGKANFAKNEAKATIARSAKESVEKIDPNVKTINRSMGDLIELQGELERVVSRLDNRNLISIDTPLKVVGGASVADEAGAAVGATASILGAPRVKARTALMLENIRTNAETIKIINNKLDPVLARQLSVLAGRLDQSMKDIVEEDNKDD